MSTSYVSRRRGRKPRKMVVYYKCSVCEYISERYYNVTRHEFRIHTTSVKKRHCCGKYFATKGDYYLHCEEHHPLSRAASIISRTKYKILPGIEVIKPRENFVASEDENPREEVASASPYMLRNRRRWNVGSTKRYGNINNSEFTTDIESSSEEESSESSSALSKESSVYETKNTSLDINQNEVETRNSTSEEDVEDSRRSCAVEISRPDQQAVLKVETDCPTFVPGACETSMSSDNDEPDKSIKNFTFGYALSANTFDLPIKKRILRDITNRGSSSHVRSTISYHDRLHRRIPSENGKHSFETRRKPQNAGIKVKNSRNISNNDENVVPLSSITDRQKFEIDEKVQMQVDPRISWHDFTRVHREYFDGLLRNRLLLDRFRQSE